MVASVGYYTSRYSGEEIDRRLGEIGCPNLLDNAYFVGGGSQKGYGVFPVNQRCLTSYSSETIGADRWACSGMMALLPEGVQFTNVLHQKMGPNIISFLNGKTLTFTALMSDGSLKTGTKTFEGYESQDIVFYNDGAIQLMWWLHGGKCWGIFNRTGEGKTIAAAKLEVGDTQTLAKQNSNGMWEILDIPNFESELLKCQRCFCKSFPLTVPPTTSYASQIYASTSTVRNNGRLSVDFPVEMIAAPTVERIGTAYCYAALNDGTEGTTYDSYIVPMSANTRGFFINQTFYNGFATLGLCWTASTEY